VLDNNYEYKVYRDYPSTSRVGVGLSSSDAITWYEYVNPWWIVKNIVIEYHLK